MIYKRRCSVIHLSVLLNRTILYYFSWTIYTKDAHVHFIKKNKKKNMRRSTPDFYSNLKFYTIYHIKSAPIFHHFYSYYLLHYHQHVFIITIFIKYQSIEWSYDSIYILEAARVLEFQHISEKNAIVEEEKLKQLGNLMSNSHFSMHKLYECSHPSVNSLVDKAMACGALGARLTGAG